MANIPITFDNVIIEFKKFSRIEYGCYTTGRIKVLFEYNSTMYQIILDRYGMNNNYYSIIKYHTFEYVSSGKVNTLDSIIKQFNI